MAYLYGDSTPSSLRDNFLEFLRDALDFCVYVLQADSRIQNGQNHIEALRRQATLELGQLEAFGAAVAQTIEATPKGAADSPTVSCAERLQALAASTVQSSMQAVRDRLAADIRQAEAEEAVERDGCHQALETLLRPHFPPDETSVARLVQRSGSGAAGGTGGYDATVDGKSEIGLSWRFELAIPDEDAFASTVTVERLMPRFQLLAPEVTGWIKKEVKTRPQRIDRCTVTEVVDDGEHVALKLRADNGVGFDLDVDLGEQRVAIARVTPSDDAASGPFEANEADVPKLLELGKMVHAALASLTRKRLVSADIDEREFKSLESFVEIVDRLVTALAPICKEISRRSLEPTELVLRRLLANDRREEIFVAKSTLREKLAPLSEGERSLFDPLGLDPALASRSALPPAPIELPVHRSELPPSQPPKPPPKPDTRAERAPPPPPVPHISIPPDEDGELEEVTPDSEPGSRLSSRPPYAAAAAPAAAPAAADRISVDRISTVGVDPSKTPRNPEVVAKLKRIMTLAKEGKTDVAYHEYGELFSSRAFADNPLEDRRQLLRLMLFAKAPAVPSDSFREAHRAAMDRLRVLVDRLGDPVDYEMLGICHLVLEERDAANAAFKKALEIERLRNPQSELCGNLMKRVASL